MRNTSICELMVGDWVKMTCGNRQIVDINGLRKSVVSKEGCDCDMAETFPIPLTEEMLLVNGFEKEYYSFSDRIGYRRTIAERTILLTLDYKTKSLVSVIESDKHHCRVEGKWKYVHELQNALRQCKLWAFADGFKIDKDES